MRFIVFGLLFLSAVYFSESYSIAKRDAQTDLLKTVTDLLAKAHAAVQTLEKEGKPALVAGLKKSITFLLDAEKQLLTLKPTTEIGKALLEGLDNLIKQGAAVLEADLKKAEGGKVKRDAKDDLVKSVENLKKQVDSELAKLKAAGKIALAGGIQKLEKLVIDAEETLKKLNPTTELGKTLLATTEALVKKLETDLEAEVKKLSGGKVKRDAQADLLKTVTDLLVKAHAAVQTLEKEGKPALVAGLKKSITFIMDVEKELLALKPTTEIGKALLEGLDKLVKQGVAALEADLKKAEGGF